jgi:hypothetical protein
MYVNHPSFMAEAGSPSFFKMNLVEIDKKNIDSRLSDKFSL